MELLSEGGLLAFITSRGVADTAGTGLYVSIW